MASKQKDAEPRVSRYQRFETETISRKQIHNAEYNPRQMTKEAERALRKGLREHGLVSAITWNRRTGNIVGGHQRLKQLDALEKTSDYELTVCVVDVDEREEAKLNVQLNSPSMQGEFDLDKLAQVAEQFDLDFGDMGFSETDVDIMFDGDDRFSSLFEADEVRGAKADVEAVREARRHSRETLKEKNGINFFTVVVFRDEAERDAFMREISVPTYEQYVTAEQVARIRNRPQADSRTSA